MEDARKKTSINRKTNEKLVPANGEHVKAFLEKNLEHIERDLKLYHDEKGIPGRQYPTDVGTIDLLCIDKDKKFVVIEIKTEKGSDKTVWSDNKVYGMGKAKSCK